MKLLLVDDHALFLEGMRSFLEANGIGIAGLARSGAEALLRYEMLRPDLVLMDLQMADCDGLEATRLIKKEYPDALVVMLTACEDQDSLLASIQAGADGYLVKSMEPSQLLSQLRSLASGETLFAPGVTGKMLQNLIQQQSANNAKKGRDITPRQAEILRLLTAGRSYKEIASTLDLKEVTVKYHINELLAKFHLSNRTQLITYVIKNNLI